MRIAPLLAGAVVALSMAATSAPASAAASLPNMSIANGNSQVDLVHWRRYAHGHRLWGGGRWNQCRAWRNECADRWPARGWRFQRCLRRHGC